MSKSTKRRRIEREVQNSMLSIKQLCTTNYSPTVSLNSVFNDIDIEGSEIDSDSDSNSLFSSYSVSDLHEPNVEIPIDVNILSSQVLEKGSISSDLASWAITHNITHSAFKDLIPIINTLLPNEKLPKDPRTILKTPKAVLLVNIQGGQSYYFGIKELLLKRLESGIKAFTLPTTFTDSVRSSNILTVTIGIDGVPISQSSNLQFWPILGVLDQAISSKPFIIGMFCGYKKPNCIFEYLQDFVDEFYQLERSGLVFNNVVYTIRISKIIADAPARSFIKNCKNHNAYYGCEKCDRKGKWAGRVIYPNREKSSVLRSDSSFIEQSQSKHHNGGTPIIKLMIGPVSQIPLDYMHLVCLGIMRKMLNVWTKGLLPHRMSRTTINMLSCKLNSFKVYIPNEFSRKTRSVSELDHWKATEFRLFLLYVGPAALKNILDKDRYCHFLLLQCAITILISDIGTKPDWNKYAESLLVQFVTDISVLYYEEMLTYNMHSLLHLAAEVLTHGPLDNFSAFPFENFMQSIKRLIRKKSDPLAQIVNRIQEIEMISPSSSKIVSIRSNSKSVFVHNGVLFRNTQGDNCFILINDKVVIVDEINYSEDTSVSFLCRQYKSIVSCPDYPCNSSLLSIFIVKNISKIQKLVPLSKFYKKCVIIPYEDESFISIPMCNNKLT